MQIDKLVHLLESPIFTHLRLQLLNVEAPFHASLLKSIYGILMCLPQGDAFRLLNERLTTVCNLRENLGMSALVDDDWTADQQELGNGNNGNDIVPALASSSASAGRRGGGKPPPIAVDMDELLKRYDSVTEQHKQAHDLAMKQLSLAQQQQEMEASRPESAATVVSSGAGLQPGQQQLSVPHQQQQHYSPYATAQSSSSSSFDGGGASERGGRGGSQQHGSRNRTLLSPKSQQDGVVSPGAGPHKTAAGGGARHPRDFMV